ncbi:MAG: malonyl-CoA decarboxylase [Rhodospirillales bacterium]|jgi:malonyl-CoA decarboxylase|nr:malonyl-CoA decarboxylase [Rhodospirillales bacterium]
MNVAGENLPATVYPSAPPAAKAEETGSLLRQALRSLRARWQVIAGTEYDAEQASDRPDLPADDVGRLREQMRACLEARGGEVTARARAAALGQAYLALDATGRERFLAILARDFDVDNRALDEAALLWQQATSEDERREAQRTLRAALEAPRVRLLTQFNSLPQGIKFLVDLRAELLALARRDPSLLPVEDDLRGLLARWFDVDFLELRRITWDTASGALLERLIAYEAVHPIESWDDLKNRLDYDRRYFAYFHPRMPNEPLIFVEVALVNGIADNVQALLDPKAPVHNPEKADTAIFYSINNAQRGLTGISFGNFLIKRVVDRLSHEFPNVKTFATLSPIPGFGGWLGRLIAEGDPGLLLPAERRAIASAAGVARGGKGWLKQVVDERGWASDETIAKIAKPILMRLAARYLVREQRPDGAALDPVAHFHLSNGARVDRLNWMGDRSPRGLQQSGGLMVNYRYDLGKIDANHEAYRANGKRAISSQVKSLLNS